MRLQSLTKKSPDGALFLILRLIWKLFEKSFQTFKNFQVKRKQMGSSICSKLFDILEFVFLIAFLLLLNNSSCSLSDTLYFENHYMTKSLCSNSTNRFIGS